MSMTNQIIIPLIEIPTLGQFTLEQNILGNTWWQLKDYSHFDIESFTVEQSILLSPSCVQLKGSFTEAFGQNELKATFWIYEVSSSINQDEHIRHVLISFQKADNSPFSRSYLLALFLQLEEERTSINLLPEPANLKKESIEQKEKSFLLNFDKNHEVDELWFSSQTLLSKNLPDFFKLEAGPKPIDELELYEGVNWDCSIHMELGDVLNKWLPENRDLSLTFNYQPEGVNSKVRLILNLVTPEPTQLDGIKLSPERLWLNFKVGKESFSFQSLGFTAHLDIQKGGKHLGEGLHIAAELNLKSGDAELQFNNFPSIEDIVSYASINSQSDIVLEAIHGNIGELYIRELSAKFNIYDFDLQLVRIIIDTKEDEFDNNGELINKRIEFVEDFKFLPQLLVEVSDPLDKDIRETEIQFGGIVHLFGATMIAEYSKQHQAFHLALIGGKLSSKAILDGFNIVSPEGLDIQVIDLELNVWKTEQWNFSGEFEIYNDWTFDVLGLPLGLEDLRADFLLEAGDIAFNMQAKLKVGAHSIETNAGYIKDSGWLLRASASHIPLDFSMIGESLGITKHIIKEDNTIGKELKDSLNLNLEIDELFVECFLPTKNNATTERFFIFYLALSIPETSELLIPLEFAFLKLNWKGKDQLEWEALVHFTFKKDAESGDTTELILESNRKDGDLSFHATLKDLHINDLIDFFKNSFGVKNNEIPAFPKDVFLEKIEVSLTKTDTDWKFTFECDTKIITEQATKEHEEKSIATQLIFTVEKHVNEVSKEKEYKVELEGHLHIPINEKETLEFGLHFHHDKEKDWLLATYQGEVEIPVSQLLESWLHSKWPELSLKISSACIFIQSKKSSSAENAETKKRERSIFLGVEMAADVQLNEMSFLKTILTDDLTAGIEQFRIAYTSSDMDKKTLGLLSTDFKKSLEKAGIEILPIPQSEENQALGKGFHLSGKLKLGKEFERPFSVGPEALDEESNKEENNKKEGESNKILLATAPTSTSSNESSLIGKWFKVEKTLGPITIARIGIQYDYQKQDLWILLDAGLQIAILEVSVDGLGIGSPLSDFHPKLSLSGMGIDFHKGALSIGGAIHYIPEVIDPPKPFSIDGRLSLGFNDLSLALLASYTTDKKGAPSFLAYGVLDFPIGGPPFFFVDGLAAGVGIHRKIEYPPIEAIAEFPLVSLALKSAGSKAGEKSALSKLNESIEVAHGEYFFAAGIRFNTFKIINSFVLLILGIGKEVELDLLGYSVLTAPLPLEDKKIDPIAQARLMLHAAFRPDAGTLKVEARLDPKESFLVARACKLQGGFAFYAWFGAMHAAENEGKAGDFVLTLGGYHPNFIIPAHYPQVPRLGFHWQVDAHMLFKGELYFAMTPNALMAGGLLEGNWKQAHLEASFRLALNLLMQWQPFHYEGDFALSMRVSYHDVFFQVDIEFSTIIYIWGPEFGGTAYLKILLLELEVDFGAAKRAKPEKLTWKDFATAFLNPIKDEREAVPEAISCRITQGLIPTEDDFPEKVEPGAFELVIESMIPITSTESNGIFTQTSKEQEKKLNITPMQRSDIDSALYISIRYVAAPEQDGVAESFQLIPVLKNAPAALWGKKKTDINADATVDNCLFGYRMQVNPGLFLRNNGTIIYPSAKLDIPTIQHEVGIYSNKEKGFEWLGTNQIDQLGVNYESTETSHLLRAFGLEQNLKASLVNSPTVDFLRPFEIETL